MIKMFSLPLDPYLENSTQWWVDKNPHESWHDYDTRYKQYQEWMRNQGVIVKNLKETLNTMRDSIYGNADNQHYWSLDFVDEPSMMVFILRWGN
jgi:hypothetical protein